MGIMEKVKQNYLAFFSRNYLIIHKLFPEVRQFQI